MQNNLNPIHLLKRLSNTNSTGCLKVSDGQTLWQIDVVNGQLRSASCSVQSVVQMDYHLRRLGCTDAAAAVKALPSAHWEPDSPLDSRFDTQFNQRAIAWLWQEKYLELEQLKTLFNAVIQEAMESLLWLTQGTFCWSPALEDGNLKALGLDLPFLELLPLLESLHKRLTAWQAYRETIWSPHQRPYLVSSSALQKLPSRDASSGVLEKLTKLMRGLSIRQLTAAIKQDELKLVQLLSPYIEQGIFYLRDPQPPFDRLPKIPKLSPNVPLHQGQNSAKVYKIVCIDDSPTILDEMQHFLGEDRYQVTPIDSPTKSLALLFEIKPDLVLMDITMPEINGYQLCNLLRKSGPAFEKIPIIMVTGNRGFIDRAKAKLSGATDYLTKPFSQEVLLSVIGKYLQP